MKGVRLRAGRLVDACTPDGIAIIVGFVGGEDGACGSKACDSGDGMVGDPPQAGLGVNCSDCKGGAITDASGVCRVGGDIVMCVCVLFLSCVGW